MSLQTFFDLYLSKSLYACAYSSASCFRCIRNQNPPSLPQILNFYYFQPMYVSNAVFLLVFFMFQKYAENSHRHDSIQMKPGYEELMCSTILRSDTVISRSDCTYINLLCYFTINTCLLNQNIVI